MCNISMDNAQGEIFARFTIAGGCYIMETIETR